MSSYFSEENPNRKVKPWWEDISDYLTHSLLIIAMLSWTFLLHDYSSGVHCILKDPKSKQFWNNLYSKYFSQKCALEMLDGCLVYYPYFAIFQWMILFFCQIFWLKLPHVNSKVEVLHQIFEKLNQADEGACREKVIRYKDVPEEETIYQRKNEDYARLRLQCFLEEDGASISSIYGCKSLFNLILIAACIGVIFHYFPKWTELWGKHNISCHSSIDGSDTFKNLHLFCNLGCGRLTFVLMCLNLCILFSFIVTSFFGYLIWKHNRIRIEKINGIALSRSLKESSGWKELCATLSFIDANRQYGDYMIGRLMGLLLTLDGISGCDLSEASL